jgi:hypothetical protein
MQEFVAEQGWYNSPNENDRDVRLEQALDSLKNANSELKSLVVRLSETIIRNVTAQR